MKQKMIIFVLILTGLNISLAANTMEVTRSSALQSTNNVELKTYDMKKLNDLTGQTFGSLTVLARVENNKWGQTQFLCDCSCGNKTTVLSKYLKAGNTKSCKKCFETTYGMKRKSHPLYGAWVGLLDRCNNPNGKDYKNYRARGITVCSRWESSFESFIEDMGDKPTPKHSLDRIDNDKGYYKDNCRWATEKQQMNNTRRNVIYTINGINKTLAEWCSEYGNDYHAVWRRINKGWDYTNAITTPIRTPKGVAYAKDRNKWRAYAYKNSKRIPLGSFNTEQEAVNARLNYIKKEEYYGGN